MAVRFHNTFGNLYSTVLWFLADKDEIVPYELSEPRIKLAFEEAGNEDYEVITVNGVTRNFFMQNDDGSFKYVDGYWNKMADWLKKHDFTYKNSMAICQYALLGY